MVLHLHIFFVFLIFRRKKNRAIEADTPEDLTADFDESDVVHWLGELDVPEVPGAVSEVGLAGLAEKSLVNCSHSEVVDASTSWMAFLIYYHWIFYFAY